MMKKSHLLFTLIILTFCLLVGCDESSIKDDDTSNSTQNETESVQSAESEMQTNDSDESVKNDSDKSESANVENGETESQTEECEHSYGEGKVTRKANCGAVGIRTYTCTLCGNTREEEIPATGEHSYDIGQVTKTPSCSEVGEKTYNCVTCGSKKTEEVEKTEHQLGHWTQIKAPTTTEEGLERKQCESCDYFEERPISLLEMRYYITVDDGINKPIQLEIGKDGKYSLEEPEKIGYNFLGWKDENGNTFNPSGTISENVSVKAEWQLDGTDSLAELIERAGAGTDKILITANITVTEPVFFTGCTAIYSDGDFTIKRDPAYAGDMFVIGRNKEGVASVWLGKKVTVNIGGGKGTLTLDGNRDALTVTVVGSAIFVSDSSVVNIHDGVVIANNKKLGNERVYTCEDFASKLGMSRAGGAALLIMNGTVNMYGGIIENNLVVTEHTVQTNDDGTQSWLESAGCGGAVYNYGNFNMYGGIIRANEALRGGAIYNDEIVQLVSGAVEGNISHTYGGAVSSSSSSEAQMFIGSEGDSDEIMRFISNRSMRTGGALYSNTSSPIVIYGNTHFISNMSDSSGGAIYTAGGLTVRGATFTENSSVLSGGAIYYLYGNPDYTRRKMELTDCVFIGNSANLGGAVILSASGECEKMGAYATITGCEFKENKALIVDEMHGNGGAMYITRKSEAIITECNFVNNTAQASAGALSVQSGSKVKLSASTFEGNSAINGGAIHTSNESSLSVSDVTFTDNAAVKNNNGGGGNGGAIYAYNVKLTLKNVAMNNNSAANNAGAVYMGAINLDLDSTVSFTGNSAEGHGGAIYITYITNEDGSKNGGVLNAKGVVFKDNTALSGGAVSARSASTVNLTNVTFTGNTTPNALVGTADGGGAIYSNNSDLTLVGVIMDGNSSGYYGGAIKLDECVTEIKNTQIINTTGGTGGAIYASRGSLTADGLTLTDNKSALNGVIYLTRVTAELKNITASGNEAVSGGLLYAGYESNVTITDSKISENSANNGGAIYSASTSTVIVSSTSFENNDSTGNGGAIYSVGATLAVGGDSSFKGNTSVKYGGAIFVHEYVYTTDVIPEGETESVKETVTVKSLFSVDGAGFENNISGSGGAIYVAKNSYTVSNAQFVNNEAVAENYGGAAIYNTDSESILSNVTFVGNTSHKGGAVALHTNSSMTVTSMTATGNSATVNTEGNLGIGGVFYVNNSSLDLVEADGNTILLGGEDDESGNTAVSGGAICAENHSTVRMIGAELSGNSATGNGGAVIVHLGTLELSNVTMTNNSSDNHGGAVSIAGAVVTVSGDSRFTGNTATNHAGAIYVSYSGSTVGQLSVKGGTFDSNSAAGGGAVSIRSNCEAAFEDTAFTNNSVEGYADENDGDGEGGGAVYVGYGTLTLKNVTATGNTASGHGGAVDAYRSSVTVDNGSFSDNTAIYGGAFYHNYGKLTVSGATVTENSNGIYLAKGTLDVSGNVTVKDNSAEGIASNVYLASGNVITVAGELTEASQIGVTTENAGEAFATTGSDVTDISEYCNSFFYDSGVPVYEDENGKLTSGFVILSQPMSSDGYTVITSGEPTYAWFTWVNGQIGEAVEGENTNTLNNKTEGVTYVCRITLNGETLITDPVTYLPTIFHPVCGQTCECDSVTHENTEWLPITNMSELTQAAKAGGNYYLAIDVVLNDSLTISSDLSLCINGKRITGEGDDKFSLFNVQTDATLTLTDCNHDARIGYIDLSTGLWREGVYDGDGEAVEYTLYGGVITGGNASLGGAIYAKGDIVLYGVNIAGNAASSNGGAIDLVGGKLTAIGDNVFVGNTAIGHAGAIYFTYATNDDGTRNGSTATIVGGAFAYNNAMAGGAVSVRSDCEATFNNTDFTNNSVAGYAGDNDGDGEGGGAIYVGFGTLTLNDVTMTNNSSEHFGGAVDSYCSNVTVSGGKYSGNTAEYGGVFSLSDDASSLTVTGGEMTGNTASLSGGAIYAGGSSTVLINGTAFSENASTYIQSDNYNSDMGGGAIFVKKSALTLTDVTLENNSTGYYGGAVLASGSDVTLNGSSTVKSNTGGTGAALYFKGSSNVTLDGISITDNESGMNGVVYTSGGTLTVTGVNASGNSAVSGGVIFASGSATVTVNNSEFSTNEASTGGVIYIDNCTLTVEGGTIQNNNSALGGAIYARMSTVEISGVKFTSNTSTGNGGAISIAGSELNITGDTSFSGNTAAKHGGAIYVSYYDENDADNVNVKRWSGILTAIDGSFNGNGAMAGGAVSIRSDCEATFNSTDFTNNSVKGYADKNDGDGEGGGAIYVGFGTLTLTDVTMTGNTAEYYGAAVDSYKSTVNVTEGTYSNNIALYSGAFFISNGDLTVSNASFTENSATYGNTEYNGTLGGGAVNVINGTLEMSGVILDSNSSGYYGGAILANASTVTVKDNSIIGNNTGKTGAALYFKDGCNVTVANTTLADNTATSNGVIYANSGVITLTDVTATGNSAYQGGVLYASGGTITFTRLKAAGNSATNGGVIYVKGNSTTVTVSESNIGGETVLGDSVTVSGNTANKGGAISIFGGTVNIVGSTLEDNTATTEGGAVYAEGGILNISDETVISNNDSARGGAISSIYGSAVNITNTTLKNNTASGDGGAILASGSTLKIEEGTLFENNTVSGNGGAVHVGVYTYTEDKVVENGAEGETEAVTVTVKADASVNGAIFKNNTASRGGALYVTNNSYTVKNTEFVGNSATDEEYGGAAIYSTVSTGELSGITLTGNTSHKGGAVALHTNSQMTVTSMTATGNSASLNTAGKLGIGGVFYVNNSTLDLIAGEGETIVLGGESESDANTAVTGGAICAENGSSVTVTNVAFQGNSSTSNGGAIYTHTGSLTLTDVTMSNNTSGNHGGAISATGTVVTVTGNSSFTDNKATNHAGAIYLSYTGSTVGVLNMTGGKFESNSAMSGGAVSIRSNCEATFSGTSFIKNSVTGYADENDGDGDGGGAIYVGFGTLTLTDVTMTDNTAEYYGAAIASVGSTVTVSGGTYSNNVGAYNGAFHAIKESKLTVTGAIFTGNKATDTATDASRGGGAIAVKSLSSVELDGVIMDGNTAGYYGGAILTSESTVIIKDKCEIKNSSGATGAAIYSRDGSNVTVTDSKLSDNTSTGSGIFYANSGTFTFINVEITGNNGKNGVFYFSGGTISLTKLSASGNSATTGGVIYANNAAVKLTVDDSTFTSNSATTGGAIAVASGSLVEIKNSIFTSNTSSNNGGAIYHSGTNTLTVTGCTFTSNTAANSGGAICVVGTGAVTVSDFTFDQNASLGTSIDSNQAGRGGGAIYVGAGSSVTVNNGSFTSNESNGTLYSSTQTDAGGAIMVNGGTLSVSGAEFIKNVGNQGGAIGTSNSTATAMQITGCTFTENTSKNNGGALFIQNYIQSETDSIVVSDCTFTDNESGTGGSGTGAIAYVRTDGSATFKNITASGNSDWSKGAIYATTRARVTLEGTVDMSGGNCAYIRGSGTTAIVNYSTEDEKTAWESVITTAESGSVSYVAS